MTNIDYELLATRVYDASDTNRTAVPEGWQELVWQKDYLATGFSAGAYRKGSEVVIAYAGTNQIGDWLNGNSAALGLPAPQVFDAMRFYLDVKAANPDATSFSFTGHSLGGGLASLMAVFFDKQATVFDEAPFQLTAIDPLILSALEVSLLATGYTDPDFAAYNASFATLFPFRENNVNHIYLDDEILAPVRFLYPTIAGTDVPLSMGDSTLSALDRHAMTLLTAMKGNAEFASLVQQLPSFATYMLDPEWFGVTDRRSEGEADLLSTLLKEQYGVNNGKLDHFVTDMAQLLGSDGVVQNNHAVRDALMATVMNYYFNKMRVNTDNLLIVASNSLNFKYSDMGNEKPEIRPLLAHEMSALLSSADSSETSSAYSIYTRLMQHNAWHIQTGNGGMTWSSTEIDSDVVIGGGQADVINTGEGNDLLYGLDGSDELNGGAGSDELSGNAGNDILNGGEGTDTLVGGAGDDTYIVDNTGDVVIENVNEGTDDTVRSSVTYTLSENVEKLILTGTDALEGTGNALNNTLTGNSAANTLDGGAGQDTLTGGDGKDVLVGGTGDDILHGDDNAGGDILEGGSGFDTYYADDGDTLRDADGQGTIYLNGKQLSFATRKAGETTWTDAAGNTFTLSGTTLQINDPLTIEGFSNGQLGIYLDEEEDPSKPLPNPGYNSAASVRRVDPLVLDLDGNGQIDTVASTSSTTYFDFNGDGIAEKSGWVAAQDGILAIDANNNGGIDNLDELFGSATQDGFIELADHDSHQDGVIDAQDADYSQLRVWQDSNQDGIAQSEELHTLTDLNISAINLAITPANLAAADNLITATGSFIRNGQTQLAADIHLAVNFAQTDSNPNRPLDQAPTLSADVFELPWLRGYGLVKSLHVAYQESTSLKQAATDLIAQGRDGIIANIDGFLAQWSGLTAAHATHGVTRTTLSTEDKVWMLETFTGQDVKKSAIEAASFGTINLGAQQNWDTNYIESQYRSFAKREAISFAIQATAKDWIKGAYYSLAGDRFVAIDAAQLQNSLVQGLSAISNKQDALFAAATLDRLRSDGVDLQAATLKPALAELPYAQAYQAAIDGRFAFQIRAGTFSVPDAQDWWVTGSGGNDVLNGNSGNDMLDGGVGSDALAGGGGSDALVGGAGDDTLNGGAGNDIYQFGRGDGHDSVSSNDTATGKTDQLLFNVDVASTDIALSRTHDDLTLTLRDTGDRITLENYFIAETANPYGVEQIKFADGAAWDFDAIKNRLPVIATAGNDILYGYDAAEAIDAGLGNDTVYARGEDDTVSGGAGNDSLWGEAGNDMLDGGAGNDSLQGGAGNDTNLFGLGTGQDVVYDYNTTAGSLDKIQIASGVLPVDVKVTRDSSHLYLSINNPDGTTDKLTLQNWFSGNAYKIEQVVFADDLNTVWDVAALNALANAATGNADYITGTTGDDAINGLGGNDTLIGEAGNDTLDGGAGNDSLQGSEGNDTYMFGRSSGQDSVYENGWSTGNLDKVQIAVGILPSDVKVTRNQSHLYLSINNPDGTTDKLTLQNWFNGDAYKIEQVVFADDPATVWDMAALSALANAATENADYITGTTGDDAINGLGGNDTLIGDAGSDTLDGDAGNDSLQGGAGNDTYLFGLGSGQDVVYDYDTTAGSLDKVQIASGVMPADLKVTRDQSHLYLSINNPDGTTDKLTLQNWFSGNAYKIEQVVFADDLNTVWDVAALNALANVPTENADYLSGLSGNDVINGLGGNDTLLGDAGDDTLDGGAGNDSLQGNIGNDTYLFGRGFGRDAVYDYDTTAGNLDKVQMASGVLPADVKVTRDQFHLYFSINNPDGTTDKLTLQNWFSGNAYKIEQVVFADDLNTVWDVAALNALANAATGNADYITSTTGDDAINGLGGNDTLVGDAGSDTLDGGAGNDSLQGGAGNDTYVFSRDSGQDSVYDYDTAAGNLDKVRIASGVMPADVKITRDQSHLYININNPDGTIDKLTLQNWFYVDAYKIEQVVFADDPATVWDVAALNALANVPTENADYLSGLSGNDVINGLGGSDTLLGDAGNDILDGGAGNDSLQGGVGNDTYVFGRDFGQDVVYDYDTTAGNFDKVRIASGILPTDVKVTRDQSYLYLSISNPDGTTDKLIIKDWFNGDAYKVEQVVFADDPTTVWDAATLSALANASTENADYIGGTAGDDTINGLGGNDTLVGGTGSDTLMGGSGNDNLQGGTGNDIYMFNLGDGQDTITEYDYTAGNMDTVRFGAGIAASGIIFSRSGNDLVLDINGTTDQLRIQNWGYEDAYRIERVAFTDGMVWEAADLPSQLSALPIMGTSGNDNLSGDAGNNTLDGRAGNDILQGRSGNDTYLFSLGGGQDTITEYDNTAGNMDTVRFGAGIAAGDITFSRGGNDLVLGINGAADQLRIQNWGNGDAYRIERVEFADGTVWGTADLPSQLSGLPIMGTNGNDNLSGDAGNNTLDGGTGNDTLQGGTGNDTYLFNLGGGQDTIIDGDSTAGNVDTVRFGAGIAAGDIAFSRIGNDLVLSINGTADQLKIQNWGAGDYYRIEHAEFADGTSWDAAYLQAQASATPLVGTTGNDTLYGDAGNNTLDGRTGNDTLQGGTGNDTYLFNLGGGQDTISDYDAIAGNVDTVHFGAGIAASDIAFSRIGNDLVLGINDTTDQLKILGWGNGDAYHIEQVEFADGTVWNAAYLQEQFSTLPIIGTTGNDNLYGDSGNNILDGRAGNDSMQGGTGNDTYLFNLGGGQDSIYDVDNAAGNMDTVRFGAGIAASNITFSRIGNDLVLSINGTADQLRIQNWGAGNAYHIERVEFADGTSWDAAYLQEQFSTLPIIGTAGNDNLYGDSGNNILDGRAGNDILQGGSGSDTYLFNLGGGQDTISDSDSTIGNVDTVRFGAGIAASNITFSRIGNDLVLSINGTADQLRIQNWGAGNAYHIERVEFADGTSWDAAYLQEQFSTLPIIGTAGNDNLYGDSGNNILDGRAGNDFMQGGSGNDTYLFNLGGGQDTISDLDSTAGNVDTVRFGVGIAAGDIIFNRSGNDLVLGINGTADQVKIQNWWTSDYYRIERVAFADGTVWDTAYIQTQVSAIPIIGTTGNDTLTGDTGNNSLDGGTGNDTLQGGLGNDIYLFGLGEGQDTISDLDYTAGNMDTIRFDTGIAASDITFNRSGNDLVLGINGTTDQVKIQYWRAGDAYRIERVEFADGTVWDTAYLQAQVSATPIIGTTGNDTLTGDTGNNSLDGGTGNDILQGGSGNDTYLFNLGSGQDTIIDSDSTAGNVDIIRFGAGIAASDITFNRSGNDLVLGINGTTDQVKVQNWLSGNVYRIERVEFADGTVWDTAYLQAQVSATPIIGTTGNDTLTGDTENNTLDGGTGNDTLQGGSGNDTYLFGLGGGQDTIIDSDSTAGNADAIRFGAGIAAGDIIFGRGGNDPVLGIKGTTDQVKIQYWSLGGNYYIERAEFADGTLWDAAYLQAQALATTLIVGTAGNDFMGGDNRNNTLDGGAGNDDLHDALGNDTYLFNLGGGQDIISDGDSTVGNVDTVRFGTGIAQSDIIFSRSGNDLVLGIKGTTDQVKIWYWWGLGDYYHIERVAFADGTAWDAAYLQAQASALPIVGTAGNNTLYGDSGNNTLDGRAGNDTLQGGSGNDTYLINLGGGQDTISDYDATAGNVDTVRFGAGVAEGDIIFSRSGNDLVLGITGTTDQVKIQNWGNSDDYHIERVEFADGTAWDAAYLQTQASAKTIVGTLGNDTLYGDSGNNTLDGRTGNDTLQGGLGNDTYLFGLGGGQDTIIDNDSTAGNVDIIRFDTGIAASDIIFSRNGNDLVLGITGTTDQVKIQNWSLGDTYHIERVEFADGTSWNTAYLQAQVSAIPLIGTTGNDTLTGDTGNNTFDGRTGNDNLQGESGNDTYLFGLGGGQDTIIDSDSTAGNIDTIRFGTGIVAGDIIFSRSGNDLVLSINGSTDQVKIQNWSLGDTYHIERIEFADGTSWNTAYLQTQASAAPIVGTTGNDTLYGDSGNNTLDGRAGNDYLQGDIGNDTYLFNLGDGQDAIIDSDSTASNADTIRFGTGITASDIIFSRSGNDVVLSITGTTDQVKVQNWKLGDAYHIERVEFANGTSWDTAYIQAQVSAIPLIGTTGNDTLIGDAGNNTFDGRAGNDNLQGGMGNDNYLFNLGDGQDTIDDNDSTVGNVDIIRFGIGITAGDITLSRIINDLVLSINGTTDQLKILNWTYGDARRIERMEFADGTAWDAAYLQTQFLALPIVGTMGNDYLYGDAGNNLLDGKAGNDSLQGGLGNDTYLFNSGGGQDTIYDNDNTAGNMDTIRFGAGITMSNTTLSRIENDLVLGINGTIDQLKILYWGYRDSYHIERAEFANGKTWDETYLQKQFSALPIIGTAGNNYLIGNSGANTLDGGAGNDYLLGDTGNDTYLFNLGGGQDTISDYDNASSNKDIVLFGAGIAVNDIAFSRSANDLVLSIRGTTDQLKIQNWELEDAYQIERVKFADGSIWNAAYLQAQLSAIPIIGTADNDTLYGDSGNNTLTGREGNDSLQGDSGNDLLQGGSDNDALTGNGNNNLLIGGTGNDTLYTGTDVDIIAFNRGDGQDTIETDPSAGKGGGERNNVLSLGGGIKNSDLYFRHTGNDLVLEIGSSTTSSVEGLGLTQDQIIFRDWYSSSINRNINTLQIIDNITVSPFDARNTRINFNKLVDSFDKAVAADATTDHWALTNIKLDKHLKQSTGEALGGDLAYQYGKNDSLAAVSQTTAQDVLGNRFFGEKTQALHNLAGLNEGIARLG